MGGKKLRLKDKSHILIVDFTTVIFRAAKMLQEDYIEVEYKNNGRKKIFKNLTEFKGKKRTVVEGWLGELNKGREEPFLLQDFIIEPKSKVVHPDKFAYGAIQQRIKSFYDLPWVKEVKLCIDGPTNYRKEIFKGYKQNRGPKPLRFLQIKDKFLEEYKDITTVSTGCEADDLLKIFCTYCRKLDIPVVYAGIDKDLTQIEGKFYNYDSGKLIEIDEFTSTHNLAIQTIIGDTIDAIPSVPKANQCVQDRWAIGRGNIGPKKAEKILKGCKTQEALWREVEELYYCYYGDEYKEKLNLTYQLVNLQSEMDVVEDFPFTK